MRNYIRLLVTFAGMKRKGEQLEDCHRESLDNFITFVRYTDTLIQKLNLSYTSIRDLITIVEYPGITTHRIIMAFNLSYGTLRALQQRLHILKMRGLVFSSGKYFYPTEFALKELGYPVAEKSKYKSA